MPHLNVRICPLALAAFAAVPAALAQQTTLRLEVSADYGDTWHDSIRVVPGQRADVRLRVELTTPPVGQTVLGLAGVTSQPTLSNWMPVYGDSRLPFTFDGQNGGGCPCTETQYDGRHVLDGLGVTGRIYPYGSGSQGVASSSGLLTSFDDAGNVLRFAGSRWRPNSAVPNGVAVAQAPMSFPGATYFNPGTYTTVFKYAVTIGRSVEERTLVATVMQVSGAVVKWYLNASGTSVLNSSDIAIVPAFIIVEARCPGDIYGGSVPNPSGPIGGLISNVPDGSVTIDDLLYFLSEFEQGTLAANLDDGSGTGTPDRAVTIDDLLYFLVHFEAGC